MTSPHDPLDEDEASEETVPIGDLLRILVHGDKDSQDEAQEWENRVTKDKVGRPRPTLNNTVLILGNAPQFVLAIGKSIFRLNQFSGEVEVVAAPTWREDEEGTTYPRPRSDDDITRVACMLEEIHCLTVSIDMVWRAMATVAAANAYDPLRDMLRRLRWDRVPRLSTWLKTYLGAEGDPVYLEGVGRAWCISAVARAFKPGCKVDTTLVLEGKQGVGKSTALKTLVGEEWFMDHLPDFGSKDAAQALAKAWVHEMAELSSMSKGEVEKHKQYLSQCVDTFRPPYGRETVHRPRRCVFSATTNQDAYLKDSTGNRRFWPVRVTRVDLQALARDRLQIWAEAVYAFDEGEPWHLREGALASAVEEQAARVEVDPWTDDVVKYLSEIHEKAGVTLKEILDSCIKIEPRHQSDRDERRVRAILKIARWSPKQVRRGEKTLRLWFRDNPS